MNNIADHLPAEASPTATPDPRRCQFSFADGRRCRSPRWEAHPALCLTHARAGCGLYLQPTTKKTGLYLQPTTKKTTPHTEDFTLELAPLSGEFRTATDINHVLGKVFSLLAQNRIPRRNAVALGYLAQLLLQTLPGVREELTRCLGRQAWDETLESVFREGQTGDETEIEQAAAEDKAKDDREASLIELGHAEPASDRQPPIDKKDAAPAQTEPDGTASVRTESAHTETKYPQTEIAPQPKPEELPEPLRLVPQMPADWNYWKELERNEHLRKMRH